MSGSVDTWDPGQYARFREERSRPFHDLLTLVQPRPRMRVADLGCGTGELTRLLHRRLKARETVGIDSSPAMLAKSKGFRARGLRFTLGDLMELRGNYDLIFSHAALQWVPDHRRLLTRLAAALRPRGQLAIQVPCNGDHPSHRVAAALARERPFRKALGGYVRRSPVLRPEHYANLLDHLGFREQQVRLQVYAHHLPSRKDVLEWMKGTTLTDYQRRMSPALFRHFLAAYRERLLPQLEDTRPFFYPFKRLLIWAQT